MLKIYCQKQTNEKCSCRMAVRDQTPYSNRINFQIDSRKHTHEGGGGGGGGRFWVSQLAMKHRDFCSSRAKHSWWFFLCCVECSHGDMCYKWQMKAPICTASEGVSSYLSDNNIEGKGSEPNISFAYVNKIATIGFLNLIVAFTCCKIIFSVRQEINTNQPNMSC